MNSSAMTAVSGTVHVVGDSGSPERVALDLYRLIGRMPSEQRKLNLDIYAECLLAAQGKRPARD